jgi:DNA-binding response OmpR family regulator
MASLQGRRILIIEDEFLLALDLELALQRAGAEVIGPASTLAKAEALAETDRLDAVVLDVRLGSEDTLALAPRFVERDVAILFHSGHAEYAEVAVGTPGAAFAGKPAAPDQIIERLAALCAKRDAN